MNDTSFHAATRNLARILETVDQISHQAEALSYGAGLATAGAPPAEARRALEAIGTNLDRIIVRAREVDLLLDALPDPAATASLQAPSVRLREAVTTLVVGAYAVAAEHASI